MKTVVWCPLCCTLHYDTPGKICDRPPKSNIRPQGLSRKDFPAIMPRVYPTTHQEDL